MAEDLIIKNTDKLSRYQELIPQLKALCEGEPNKIANLSNIVAGLKETFGFFWIGFYFVDSPKELVLGPFQGPVACTRIQKGRGVCGKSWEEEKAILVEDVEQFPGHIACSSRSKSEIVVPVFKAKKVVAIIDVDSDKLNDFDEVDKKHLNKIAQWVGEVII